MKKILALLAVMIFLGGLMSGCDGVAYTHAERMQRYRQIQDFNNRQLVDDWDYLILRERGTYLSQWYPHVSNPN